MNNEPVAWMTAQGIQDVCTVNEKEEMGNDFDDYTIPLYTHPAKTLTDDEIQEIAHDYGEIGWLGDTTYEFARAILRKAQEK
jgi:hypothetical protein